MNLFISIIALLLFTLSLTGCPEFVTRSEMKELEQRRVMDAQVQTIQQKNADQSVRLAELEALLREQNGQVEVLQNNLRKMEEEKLASSQEKEDLKSQISTLKEDSVKLNEQMQAIAAALEAIKNQPKTIETKEAKSDVNDLYKKAEELFAEKDWKTAALTYQKFKETRPKDKRVADATYKMGVCFQELGLKDESAAFYEEVISRFPGTSAAKKSQTRLKSLKK